MTLTNTTAYYNTALITAIKGFMHMLPGPTLQLIYSRNLELGTAMEC